MEVTTSELMNFKNVTILATAEEVLPNLRRWRMYRGLTLKNVVELTSMNYSTIQQIETGKSASPSFANIVRLCKLYKVKLTIK